MSREGLRSTIIFLTIYSIAMGFLESTVVVYLREIYSPDGFQFPLKLISGSNAITEVIREFATLVMLLSVAILAGKNFSMRFAIFFYCFAIWDIFYYIFLKILLNWPESLLTWDILFLIPVIWSGPVLTPLIVSLSMIVMAGIILGPAYRGRKIVLDKRIAVFLTGGFFLVFLSMIWDFMAYVIRDHNLISIFQPDIIHYASMTYIPVKFNWALFFAGELVFAAGLFYLYTRNSKSSDLL